MIPNKLLLRIILSGTGLLAASAALPVAAQPAPEDITVFGRYGKVPGNVRSLSQSVSYADLDLSTPEGRHILESRVRLTARYLCDKLGEPMTASPPVPSCRDAATSDAMSRIGTLEAHFAPRGTTWVRGPAWQPPYPADWATRYPYPPR